MNKRQVSEVCAVLSKLKQEKLLRRFEAKGDVFNFNSAVV